MPITRKVKSAVGMGSESTWATAVARDRWLEMYSCTLQERPRILTIDTQYQAGQPDWSADTTHRIDCDGELELPLLYEGWGTVWKYLMGAASSSTTGTGPFVHTFNRGDGWGPSWGQTFELLRGNQSTQQSEVFAGVVMPRASIIWERDRLARARISLLAKKANAARGNGGTPTFGGSVVSRMCRLSDMGDAGALTFNSVLHVVKRLELIIDNGVEGVEEAGSLYISEACRQRQGEILVKATLLHRADTLYAAHLAYTESNLTWGFASGSNAMAFTGRNAKIIDYSDPISAGQGLVEVDATWRCKADSSNGALSVVVTNSQSSSVAN